MHTDFLRTLRSLETDRSRASLWGAAIVTGLLLMWAGWFVSVPVPQYEVTDTARIEIDRAVHPIQSDISGRIRENRLEMGRTVQAGDVLLELDAGPEQMTAAEERTHLDGLLPQLAAIREQLAAIDRTEARERDASRVALSEAEARFREADASAALAEQDKTRLTTLHQRSLVSNSQLAQSEAEAVQRRAAAESLHLAISRLDSEQRVREADRDGARKKLQGEISRLESEHRTASATLARMQFEVERRTVRAPISGRIGEAQILRVGSFIRSGEALGAIVPLGAFRIVAEFPPSVMGRLWQGQPAELRLQGFPWAEYGSIRASVAAVAEEIRNGHVRVELVISAVNGTRIPLQHGLPGTVQVEVEHVTPARLLLRAAGQLMAAVRIEKTEGHP